ncbi:OmpH/Skp family outer membrane protein [Wolbachia endosymbiont of Chironomus riparius]|uniref:OmpH family outer membrane protein n=1 Tax=Wolbachia endosymbiont of Chironomus riparius TaxID=2883238 RepID=UPI0020A1A889|nr:OmpH family outer membrane protein [Wolbachia endosymbiont of Chironomus riparius]
MINDSLALQDLQEQIKKYNSKLQQEFEQEIEKIKPSKEEFDLLSEEAKKEKIEQFNEHATKFREDYSKKVSNLENNYKNAVESIFNKIKEVTKKIAENEKIDLVLFISNKNQVLYSKDKVDLSNKTLKNINKDLPTFTLNVE